MNTLAGNTPSTPAYPLQGTNLDLLRWQVDGMSPDERRRFRSDLFAGFLDCLRANTFSLTRAVSYRERLRDFQRLLQMPADQFLRAEDGQFERNVLGLGGPGATHKHYSRFAMPRVKTDFGHLEYEFFFNSRSLCKKVDQLLTPGNKIKAKYRGRAKDRVIPLILNFLRCDHALCCAFQPAAAKYLVDQYMPSEGGVTLVDPCAGYFGRMVGALLTDRADPMRYIGIDPDKRNKPAFDGIEQLITRDMAADLPAERVAHLSNEPFEDWRHTDVARGLRGQVDMVFTSPPYFRKENYNPSSGTQSANRYPAYPKWRDGFLVPVIDSAFDLLRDNGVFILNIANVAGALTLECDAVATATAAGFVFEKLYKLKMPLSATAKANGVTRNTMLLGGVKYKFEPVFVFRKTGVMPAFSGLISQVATALTPEQARLIVAFAHAMGRHTLVVGPLGPQS